MDIESSFKRAMRHLPYPYQARLAVGASFPQVLSVPTSVGKTTFVVWV